MNKQRRSVQNLSPATVTIAAQCFGVSVGVQCRPEDAEAVSAHLPLGCTRISSTEAEHNFVFEVHRHSDTLFSVRRESSARDSAPQLFDSALKTLQKELHICIAEHATRHVFVHAGVVAWKNHLFLFPGFSHAGKSTLICSLVQAGALYYSDEYAVFDDYGRVYPFALPISLRLAGGGRHTIIPDNVGTSWRRPDIIIFARYRPGAIWRPQTLQPAAALLQLIRHSIAIRRNPALVLPVLKSVSIQCQTFVGTRGETNQLLEWMGTIA
jgi:hypothetical protein